MRRALAILIAALPATAAGESFHPPASVFRGDFALVGQGPEWGAAYAGTGRIEEAGEEALTLTRRIGGAEIVETARFEVPDPPGEGWMLKLYDRDGALVGGCLWQTDLDNYMRLTCLRGEPGVYPDMPGLEAWFPLF